MVEKIFGGIAFVTTVIGLLPQVIKSYRTKSVGDLSMFMLLNCWVCAFAWLVYAVCIHAQTMLWSEVFCLIVCTISVYQKIKYDP
ncbi:MAG: PQ-loop repeat-containing protein [Opitutales bacterium]|nr:PQ-loop repeat-containing protein [Opitutales bacterium]